MSIGDEIADKVSRNVKRGTGFLSRLAIRKIVNHIKNKPKKMRFKKLDKKFSSIEKIDVDTNKIKAVKKSFKKNKISFSMQKNHRENSYSIYYPSADIHKVEKAMENILEKQMKTNLKSNSKEKANEKGINNSEKIPLKERLEMAEQKANEMNKQLEMKREQVKSKSVSRGELEL